MRIQHARRLSRRRFLGGLTLAGTAGLLGLSPWPVAAEPPPETTRLRLMRKPSICEAAEYVAEDLLQGEGFTDVRYVEAESFVHSPHKLLIDGEWVEAASGQTFATLNPATEETLAEVAHGQAEDIERAVRAARRAFDDDSPWRRMNASDRGRII